MPMELILNKCVFLMGLRFKKKNSVLNFWPHVHGFLARNALVLIVKIFDDQDLYHIIVRLLSRNLYHFCIALFRSFN